MHKNTWLQTRSGGRLDLLSPKISDICWADIAIGLARCALFAGQTSRCYSVAEHSIRVGLEAERLCPGAMLAGLLHDAHKAYLGEWTGPLQGALMEVFPGAARTLHDLKHLLQRVIWMSLGEHIPRSGRGYAYTREMLHAIQGADLTLLATEARDLLPGGPQDGWAKKLPTPLGGSLTHPRFFEGHAEVVPDLPTASAWLSAVEQAAGLEIGGLVPLVSGTYSHELPLAEDMGSSTWLGFPLPRRRW